MTKQDIIKILEQNRDARGMAHWEKMGKETRGLKSFGIGLTKLRKFSRDWKIGRNHKLALELWDSDYHDLKIIGLLIDDPKLMTIQQVEEQVENVDIGYLAHVFCTCGSTLAKTAFAFDIANKWIKSESIIRRSCGYGLIYELAKNKRNKKLTDEFFLSCIDNIRNKIASENHDVKLSMGGALMGIGLRNRSLNIKAIKLAEIVSPIDYSDTLPEGSKCQPLDILKHLTSDYAKKKFGIK